MKTRRINTKLSVQTYLRSPSLEASKLRTNSIKVTSGFETMISTRRCWTWTRGANALSRMTGSRRARLPLWRTTLTSSPDAQASTQLKRSRSITHKSWRLSSPSCPSIPRSTKHASRPTSHPAQTSTWSASPPNTKPSTWCPPRPSHLSSHTFTTWSPTSSHLTFPASPRLTTTSLWSLWSHNVSPTPSSCANSRLRTKESFTQSTQMLDSVNHPILYF